MIERLIHLLVRLQSALIGNRRYKLLYQEMLAGFAVHRMLFDGRGNPVDYIFLDVNPAFERLTGLSRRKIVGHRVLSVLPETERIWIERYGTVVKSGTSDTFEAYSQAIGKHYMVVAFSLGGDDFGVTFYETSTVHQLQAELMRAYDETLEGWAKALDVRDHETGGHSQRVARRAVWLAKKWGISNESEIVAMARGGLLHDIGKIGVPDAILLKPGPLTSEERKIMEQHPLLARQFIDPISYLQSCVDIPYCHHEKWDGTGYPRCLRGASIPIAARLFSVIDVWDALTNDRPYRAKLEVSEASEIIRSYRGTFFQPEIVDLFLLVLAEME